MIQPVQPAAIDAVRPRSGPDSPAEARSFADLLQNALRPVSDSAAEAAQQSVGLLTGETASVHSVVLAAEKADLALRLTLQLRNKALDAYNEIMRMQL